MQAKGGEGEKCCVHPQHIIIGVCAFCLNERLLMLLLASNQELQQQQQQKHSKSNSFSLQLPKLFAFTAFLSRFDSFKHKKTQQADVYDDDDEDGCSSGGSTSQEDSFISIKFNGSGGVGSWEKMNTKPKVSAIDQQHKQQKSSSISSFNQIPSKIKDLDQGGANATTTTTTSVIIERITTRGPLRWHKRIGHMFHVNRWKRPTKTTSINNNKGKGKGHVPSNIEGHHVKVKHGWIRSLTKRRTKD